MSFNLNDVYNNITEYAPKRETSKILPKKGTKKQSGKKNNKKKTPKNSTLSGPWKMPDELAKLGAGAPKVPIKTYHPTSNILNPILKFGKGYMSPVEPGKKYSDIFEDLGNTVGNFPGTGVLRGAPIAIGALGKIGKGINLGLNDINISTKVPKTSISGISDTLSHIQTNYLDRFMPIGRITKGMKLDASKNPSVLLKRYLGGMGIANYKIDNELRPIIRQVGRKEHDDFRKYLISHHANELAEQGIGNRADKALEELTAKYGNEGMAKFDGIANQLYGYQRKLWDQLYESGMLSKEGYEAALKKYKKYIPFNEALDDVGLSHIEFSAKGITPRNPVKKIEKGLVEGREFRDPYELIVNNTYNITRETEKNRVMRALTDLGEDVGIRALRTAGNVNARINLWSKAKELRPIQNRVSKLISTSNKYIKSLQSEINALERRGFNTQLKQGGKIASAPDDLVSGIKTIKGKIETSYAISKNKGARSTKKFIEQLITDPNMDVKRLKKQVVTRENKLGPLLDEVQRLKEEFKSIRTIKNSIVNEARILKDASTKGKSVITVFRDGIKEIYEVPKKIESAVKGMDEEQLNMAVRAAALPARLIRSTAVALNIGFAVPNVIRDQLSAAVNSKYGGIPIYDFISGLASTLKKDKHFKEWVLSGADQASFFAQDRTTLQRTVGDITRSKWARRGRIISNPFEALRAAGEYSEKASRVGVYKRAIKGAQGKLLLQRVGLRKNPGLKGFNASLDAMEQSREATVDFARRGSKMKVWNALIPFLNARTQGSAKLLQSFKRPGQTLLVGGAIASVPAAILYAYDSQFQEYNDIPDYIKNDYFIIMTGNKEVPFYKIAKGEVGKIFANPVEHFMAYVKGKDSQSFSEMVADLGVTMLPVSNIGDAMPAAVKTPFELYNNVDMFRQKNIADPHQPVPELQFSDRTSETAKVIGKKLGMSPDKLEYGLTGYTTELGRQGLQASDKLLFNKDTPTQNLPILNRFMGEPKDLSGLSHQIYNQLDKNIKQYVKENYSIKEGLKKGNRSVIEGVSKQRVSNLSRSARSQTISGVLPPNKKALYSLSKSERSNLYKSNKKLALKIILSNTPSSVESNVDNILSTAKKDKWTKKMVLEALSTTHPLYGMNKKYAHTFIGSLNKQQINSITESTKMWESKALPIIQSLRGR